MNARLAAAKQRTDLLYHSRRLSLLAYIRRQSGNGRKPLRLNLPQFELGILIVLCGEGHVIINTFHPNGEIDILVEKP